MTWLSFHDFEAEKTAYDDLVQKTPAVDVFCSRAHWILPAQRVYAPGAQPFIWRTETSYAVFMLVNVSPGVICAMPLEIGWGLACPLIGADPDRAVGALAAALSRASLKPNYVMITGLAEGGGLSAALDARFGAQVLTHQSELCVRRVADLSGGVDGFLSRRSSKFRGELRRKSRQIERMGLTCDFVTTSPVDHLMRRIVEVEKQSWKGLSDQGVDNGLPLEFYQSVVTSLIERNAFRGLFVQLDGQDIAFAFGGVEGLTFRGLQLSFRHEHRSMAPGNYAQLQLIKWLSSQGVARYDLGMDMPYKLRWAEEAQVTQTRLIVV